MPSRIAASVLVRELKQLQVCNHCLPQVSSLHHSAASWGYRRLCRSLASTEHDLLQDPQQHGCLENAWPPPVPSALQCFSKILWSTCLLCAAFCVSLRVMRCWWALVAAANRLWRALLPTCQTSTASISSPQEGEVIAFWQLVPFCSNLNDSFEAQTCLNGVAVVQSIAYNAKSLMSCKKPPSTASKAVDSSCLAWS